MQRLMARERSGELPGAEEQANLSGQAEWNGIALYRRAPEMV